MIELLGFWFTATLLVLPIFVVAVFLAETLIDIEVGAVTNDEKEFKPAYNWYMKNIWRPVYHNDWEVPWVLFCIFYGAGVLIFNAVAAFGGIVDCETGVTISYVQAIANASVGGAPVLGYIAIPVMIIVAHRVFLRPVLKRAYNFMKKVEKL